MKKGLFLFFLSSLQKNSFIFFILKGWILKTRFDFIWNIFIIFQTYINNNTIE